MGKWCRVKCDCSTRVPLPGSNWHDYESYQKYQTPLMVKTRQDWEEKIKGMYQCGHRSGALIQFWPGDLIMIGISLEGAYKQQPDQFETFRRLSNWRNYEDEYLALSTDEVIFWQLEIVQLQRYFSGEAYMEWHKKRAFEYEMGRYELLYGDLTKTLEDGLKLCDASVKTRNSIEFFW